MNREGAHNLAHDEGFDHFVLFSLLPIHTAAGRIPDLNALESLFWLTKKLVLQLDRASIVFRLVEVATVHNIVNVDTMLISLMLLIRAVAQVLIRVQMKRVFLRFFWQSALQLNVVEAAPGVAVFARAIAFVHIWELTCDFVSARHEPLLWVAKAVRVQFLKLFVAVDQCVLMVCLFSKRQMSVQVLKLRGASDSSRVERSSVWRGHSSL